MSSLKFTNPGHWARIEQHLAQATGERFAFALTKTIHNGSDGPILEVVDTILIDDDDTEQGPNGWYLADHALDHVHNRAVTTGQGLIEFHNHRLGPPGFSLVDEASLKPMVSYVLDLLPGIPYGAAVWAKGAVHADWWSLNNDDIERRSFHTVTVLGDHLRILNSRAVTDERFDRQLPLLTPDAQAAIATMRVAIVGAGGTGSYAALNLAYLGFRNVLLLDDDRVETTNLNRLVTADHADVGTLKTVVAQRRLRAIDPLMNVGRSPSLTATGEHPELHDVDLIIGCVDHDGPRHRLNQIAVDTRTPYIDIATGIDNTYSPVALGGRVVFVLPNGPCLACLDELDSAEISRWSKSSHQMALDRLHGYGTGAANPSVVHLNGIAVNAALAELTAWLSGARPPAIWLDIDLLGSTKQPGIQVGPRQNPTRRAGCIACDTTSS